ncbi:Pentatricopeptide repeat-containing protein [Frankliniella fusca]|uniref:Pentatricopeptide repeat-containing protein n=1 Tax=Frankliniella fusca TaxID=407009 RepID=A0AAE1GWT5_9NEOP|nr:Pentatricopeptide repeat-containing protein [Frankliniella fusca]
MEEMLSFALCSFRPHYICDFERLGLRDLLKLHLIKRALNWILIEIFQPVHRHRMRNDLNDFKYLLAPVPGVPFFEDLFFSNDSDIITNFIFWLFSSVVHTVVQVIIYLKNSIRCHVYRTHLNRTVIGVIVCIHNIIKQSIYISVFFSIGESFK